MISTPKLIFSKYVLMNIYHSLKVVCFELELYEGASAAS